VKVIIISILFGFSSLLNAEETAKEIPQTKLSTKVYEVDGRKLEYTAPTTWQWASTMPANYGSFFTNSFSFTNDNLKGWGAIVASSAIMIAYDQEITEETKRFAKRVGISDKQGLKGSLNIFGVNLMRGPDSLEGAMYFIGDGWITIGLTAGFATAGYISKDEREMTVAHELMQGLLLTGVTTQVLKRLTGRESPMSSTEKGGKWTPVPSFSEFQKKRSHYDAFPSGHLATTMTTYMILSENYPEYTWIKPVGWTMMGLLSFQMVNNSVHWAGDYPLALGIGYMLGKTIVENGRKDKTKDGNKSDVTVLPYLAPGGQVGLNATATF
jgi:hypothetical protein